jgi:hypothetical protein
MSAPDTNVTKQARRHKPALWGIAIALGIAAVAAVVALTSNEPLAEDQAAPAVSAPAATQ